jgi:hypothetical protein
MSNNKYRINIPSNPTEAIELMTAIKAKHEELGATSPLTALDWTKYGIAHTKAEEQDKLSDELRKQSEVATGARDAEMPTVKDGIRSCRDILSGIHRDNPDALSAYGFTVTDAHSSENDETPEPVTP